MRSLRKIPRTLRRLRENRSGVVGPAVAVLAPTLVVAAGLALDVGLYYIGNRDLRSATEAAALAAAMDPAQAQARAATYLVKNGYPASVLKSVQVGYYCANINGPYTPGSRFAAAANLASCPGSSAQNAVRVTTGKTGRRFLTGVLGSANPIPDLAATASAARIDEAGVSVTSDILKLTSGGITQTLVGAVNGLLGGLLGITLNLSAPDISALMNGNVDAGRFFDSLASRTGYSGTYGGMLNASYGMKDIALAAADAAYNPSTADALKRFGAIVPNSYAVPIGRLFGLGVWRNIPVGEANVQPSLRAGLNAYQLLAFSAQEGPGVLDLSKVVSLAVPGSAVKVAAVANGPMAQPRFAFGAANETSVSTSQMRLKLLVGLGKVNVSLPLMKSLLQAESIPVLIDIAPSSAQITAIGCAGSAEQINDTTVDVYARSGLVQAYIADTPDAAMTKQMIPVVPKPVTLAQANVGLNVLGLEVGVVNVAATANVAVGPVLGNSGTIRFGPGGRGMIGNPTAPGKSANIANGSQVGATLNGLIGGLPAGLDAQVTLLKGILPISLSLGALTDPLIAGLKPAIVDPLTSLVSNTVDPLLDNVLAALGVQLGDATVWTTGARCGVPVLI